MSKYEKPNVWMGGEGTGDMLDIEPTGYTSPRLTESKRKRKHINEATGGHDVIKVYYPSGQFGFTRDDVYFSFKDIIEGRPKKGARIQYTVLETAKGKRAKNIYIGGVS